MKLFDTLRRRREERHLDAEGRYWALVEALTGDDAKPTPKTVDETESVLAATGRTLDELTAHVDLLRQHRQHQGAPAAVTDAHRAVRAALAEVQEHVRVHEAAEAEWRTQHAALQRAVRVAESQHRAAEEQERQLRQLEIRLHNARRSRPIDVGATPEARAARLAADLREADDEVERTRRAVDECRARGDDAGLPAAKMPWRAAVERQNELRAALEAVGGSVS
ncbi:MAG: hypothetical protein H6837_07565 [Planctomycetes bacterium]|nr:hypothetical protein [Planctomycetota bacterium]